MRGYVLNPSGMNTRRGDRGWLVRQQEALEREAARVRMIEESLANAPAEAERRRQQEAEIAERREANKRLRVTCPCCGVGPVPVLTAERVLAAFDRSKVDENAQIRARQDKLNVACPVCDGAQVDAEKGQRIAAVLVSLPADYEAFDGHLQILFGIATGQPYHGIYALRVANGAIWPRRADAVPPMVAPTAPTTDLHEPAKAAPVATRKAAPPPPWLDPDAVLED